MPPMVRQTGKPEIARLEVTLFQMLEGTLRIELGVARQMHLAILADDFCVPVDQDRRVEMMTISGETTKRCDTGRPVRTAHAWRRSASRVRTRHRLPPGRSCTSAGKNVVSASSG